MPTHNIRPSEPTVTIVVPAWNEARNLELVLPSLPDVHEVIVVDGHSVDDSEAVVRRTLPTARFLQQTRRGKGNALAVGFEAATGDIVVMFDADGSADASEISAYVSTLVAGADFAKGSRVLGDGGSEDITRLRDAGNRVLTGITNKLFRTHYTDLCYGYNAFWRDILPLLAIPSSRATGAQWGDGFEIETMINTRTAAANLQIHEVPSVELARIHGESNLNTFRDGFRVLRTIFTERLRRGTTSVPTPSADTLRHESDAELTHLQSHPLASDPARPGEQGDGLRALLVGPGWRFTSGVSYYTCSLANALSASVRTDALLMRQLIPTFLYPGRERVGQRVNELDYLDGIEVYDGVDWSWGKSMRDADTFVEARNPQVVVLQWWTGAVLHSYLRLARRAKKRGAKVIMEWHEVQDTGEARVPGVERYVSNVMGRLLRYVDAHVVHSTYDLELLEETYGITASGTTATVIPHGPYDHVREAAPTRIIRQRRPDAGQEPFNILFFGVIRPFKGLEDLVAAFQALPENERRALSLTIVGETWEGWDAPLEAVAASPVRDQITVVNRYVTDAEAKQHFAAADAVVLPYHRSSSSGPLQMAMSAGLPVVVTAVGGLIEAASGYDGVRFVQPQNVSELTAALAELPRQRGQRYSDIRSWDTTVDLYSEVFAGLGLNVPTPEASEPTSPLSSVS